MSEGEFWLLVIWTVVFIAGVSAMHFFWYLPEVRKMEKRHRERVREHKERMKQYNKNKEF